MHLTYQHLRMVLLCVGCASVVWVGAGWAVDGPPASSGSRRMGTEPAAGGGYERGAPPLVRDRLREDEQIHRIYLCTTRSKLDPESDQLERSWACVATSDDG
jgi:hypothetical protein